MPAEQDSLELLIWRVENSAPEPGDLPRIVAELLAAQERYEHLLDAYRDVQHRLKAAQEREKALREAHLREHGEDADTECNCWYVQALAGSPSEKPNG